MSTRRVLAVVALHALSGCGGDLARDMQDAAARAPTGGVTSPRVPAAPGAFDGVDAAAGDPSAFDASAFDASAVGASLDAAGSAPGAPACPDPPCRLYTGSGNGFPTSIAVDSKRVYFAENMAGSLLSVDHTGGHAITLASDPRPVSIAVNATALFWTSQFGAVKSVPLGGGSVTTIATSMGETAGIVLDDHAVYWTLAGQGGSVLSAPLGGGAVTTIASGQDDPLSLALGSGAAYWINGDIYDPEDSGCLMTALLDGGAPAVLSPWVNLGGGPVVTDAKNVYWVESGTLYRKALVGGGLPTPLASGGATDIAVDSDFLYWTDRGANAVMKVPVAGGASVKVATSFQYPMFLAIDATNVYWTDFADLVMTAPK